MTIYLQDELGNNFKINDGVKVIYNNSQSIDGVITNFDKTDLHITETDTKILKIIPYDIINMILQKL